MSRNWSRDEAIKLLAKNGFETDTEVIYGAKGTGTNGTGAAIDFLIRFHEFSYFPAMVKPKKR